MSIRNIIEKFWQAHSTGDAEALTEVLAEDLVWTVVGKHSPVAQEYIGRDAFFGELLAGLADAFDMSTLKMDLRGIYVDEEANTGVIHLQESAIAKTGNSFDNEIIDVLTVENGKITKVREIMDLAEVNQAFGVNAAS